MVFVGNTRYLPKNIQAAPGTQHSGTLVPKATQGMYGLWNSRSYMSGTWSTPPLPFNLRHPQIPSNRDHKALNRATLGGFTLRVQVPNHKVFTQNHNNDSEYGIPEYLTVRYSKPLGLGMDYDGLGALWILVDLARYCGVSAQDDLGRLECVALGGDPWAHPESRSTLRFL